MRLSPGEEEEPPERIMGLDLSTWEDRSYEQRERSLHTLSSHTGMVQEEGEEHARIKESSSKVETEVSGSVPTSSVVVRERTVDEPSQKTTRAKRESRRMRELEQAKFSLELLKVRATSGGASSPTEERRWSLELMPSASPPLRSPEGTPDSQSSKGSFELLMMDDEPPKAIEEAMDSEDTCSPLPPVEDFSTSLKPAEPQKMGLSDAVVPQRSQSPAKTDLSVTSAPSHPPKTDNLPTFYIPAQDGSAVTFHHPAEEHQQNKEAAISTTTTSVTKSLKDRRESARRPMVVVISMQKETPLTEELSGNFRPPLSIRDSAAQTGDVASSQKPAPAPAGSAPLGDQAVIEKLVRLNEEKEERQRNQQQQNEKEMMEQIRQQKEVLEQQRLYFAQYGRDMFEKKREVALHKIQQNRQGGQDPSEPLRPSSQQADRPPRQAPHGRTLSDSTPPLSHSPPVVDSRGSAHLPQLPPPPSSAPTERRKESRPAEGWAPKLKLESRDGGGTRGRTAAKKPPGHQGSTVSMTDKPGNIFFSPKDKVTFTA